MIFSELYGAYYKTVGRILAEAVSHPVSAERIGEIIKEYAFSESIWAIPEAIKEERWQLLMPDGTTPLTHKPSMPVTLLQKQWLKAVSCDPRIKLFGDMDFGDLDVEPLFSPTDYIVFDKCLDGDPYTDAAYIANFRLILQAIKKQAPLSVETLNKKGNPIKLVVLPEHLEYSEKDDKFRLICYGDQFRSIINLGRVISCKLYEKELEFTPARPDPTSARKVVFELKDERNALERALLHFAYLKKTAERMEEDRYRVTIYYDREDEKEILIRVLSFGPMIKVTEPSGFIDLIKQRLLEQKKL